MAGELPELYYRSVNMEMQVGWYGIVHKYHDVELVTHFMRGLGEERVTNRYEDTLI